MTEQNPPITDITDATVEAMLRRALRNTLILGLAPALALWIFTNWRNAAMLATGTAISAASILEWRRLVRFINAHLDGAQTGAQMDKKPVPRAVAVSAIFFVLRLTLFAAAIYVSLKCFRGSAAALLCGLGLAVVVMAWEGLRLLRN